MNYYEEIKQKLIDNEIYEKVKDYSKEKNRVITYFEVGKMLDLAGKHYGEGIIKKYSEKLVSDVGKKYNYRTLYRMRKMFIIFSDEKLTPLVSKLNWSHYIQLLSIKSIDEIKYYINQCIIHNFSKRQLQEKIKNKEYERLPEDTKLKLINQDKLEIKDMIKNPIVIKNKYNTNKISEKMLHNLILEDMDNFLEELGEGFSYIKSEYKIKLDNTYNFIDILLYNINYNCYVVVELKVTELKKEYIGQIKFYMNYIDEKLKKFNQNKTMGIIICRENNSFVIKYLNDKRISSKEFILI